MEVHIKAKEISGQFKFFKKSQEIDCTNPIKTPIKGLKRAILLNLGFTIGH